MWSFASLDNICDNNTTTNNRRKDIFLKEQINPNNKPEVNSTFQLQIDTIRSADDDIEKVEFIIKEKKALLKNSKDVHESDRLFAELDGLEWLQRQIARYSWEYKEGANTKDMMPTNTTFPTINKSPSYCVCCKCTAKPDDYYILTGIGFSMITVC